MKNNEITQLSLPKPTWHAHHKRSHSPSQIFISRQDVGRRQNWQIITLSLGASCPGTLTKLITKAWVVRVQTHLKLHHCSKALNVEKLVGTQNNAFVTWIKILASLALTNLFKNKLETKLNTNSETQVKLDVFPMWVFRICTISHWLVREQRNPLNQPNHTYMARQKQMKGTIHFK